MNTQGLEVNIEYNKFDIVNKQLVLIYDIKLVNFSDKNVSKQELETKIKKLIPKGEGKYIRIKSLSTKNVYFIFDADNWFKSKLKLVDTANRYVKKILLNKLPTMILNNINAVDYTRIIEGSFRNYLAVNQELKQKITNSVAENLPLVYYRFKYDGSLNAIIVEVKEQFRHNIMAVLKSKKNLRKELKKMDFDSSVETYLKFVNKKKG